MVQEADGNDITKAAPDNATPFFNRVISRRIAIKRWVDQLFRLLFQAFEIAFGFCDIRLLLLVRSLGHIQAR